MEIKETPGQTLLTLIRVVIYAVAALCSFGINDLADSFFTAIRSGEGFFQVEQAQQQPPAYGEPYILYYDQDLGNDNKRHVYRQYFIFGGNDAYGLKDSVGNQLLPAVYQGIIVLPESYLLQENGLWRFYSHDLELLSDDEWEDVEIAKDESGKISSDLVKVCRDDLYGAADQQGEIMVSPRWESLELYALEAGWPLIRVSSDGKYGYIDRDGNVVIRVRYDYAQMGEYLETDSDGQQRESTVIYVYRDEQWGAIFKNRNGDPSEVNWDISPSEEILADWQAMEEDQ